MENCGLLFQYCLTMLTSRKKRVSSFFSIKNGGEQNGYKSKKGKEQKG